MTMIKQKQKTIKVDGGKLKTVSRYRNNSLVSEKFYLNGSLTQFNIHYPKYTEERYLLNNEFHREDGPAVIRYDSDGNVFLEIYYRHGKRHREDGPALVLNCDNEITNIFYWYDELIFLDDYCLKIKPSTALKVKIKYA